MERKSMRDFIKENRADIDRAIKSIPGLKDYSLNDKERRDFIANDEGLYLWAKAEGVRV